MIHIEEDELKLIHLDDEDEGDGDGDGDDAGNDGDKRTILTATTRTSCDLQ